MRGKLKGNRVGSTDKSAFLERQAAACAPKLCFLCLLCGISAIVAAVGCDFRKNQGGSGISVKTPNEPEQTRRASLDTDSKQTSTGTASQSTSADPIIAAKRESLDELGLAKQEYISAIQQANDERSHAIEQYKREFWAVGDQYHSMTPQEKSRIHSRSLTQIQENYEKDLGRARAEYSARVEKVRKAFEQLTRQYPAASGELMRPEMLPDSGQSELAGLAFEFERRPTGYLSSELCSQTSLGLCYPHDWKPWLKALEQNIAAERLNDLEADSGMQDPGTIVVSWDKQKRVLFEACRSHDCPDGQIFFIVGPVTRELDIVWRNESGVQYLGPNATKLANANAFEWLTRIAQ